MVKGWDSNNLQAAGDALLSGFFAAHPEEQAHFSKFANVKNLSGNAAFHAQSLAVASYLDQMLKGDAVALFKAKVADHKPRGIGASSFNKILDFIPGFYGGGEWNDICKSLKAAL